MERARLIVNFDSSCDKLLSTENVVARGETFDILFRDVTLSGTVRIAFWDYETLLWRSEGSASQRDGGSVLEGLVADTKELADVFRGGSGFFAARLTVGEQVGGDEWRDYGVAYVRLYSGTDPSENPPPARPDVYPTEDELNAWLEAAGEVREGVCTCAKASAASAEAAASSARLASAQALDAVNAAGNAQHYASDASDASISAAKSYANAEDSRKAADSAAQVARDARENAQLQQQQATAAAGNANGYRQQAQNAQRLAERAQEKAEAAQQSAETARDQAAQSAQESRQKADEANQAAADAGSANSAAQSAKAAAEAAQKAAEVAKADAQAAKTGAETAKAGAESAKASAEAAAGQAASSATNAAQSATAAQEAAQGLQEGLATLNALDGRVTFLESGEGVYKDPSNGKVKTFIPFEKCADGTLQVLGDGGFFKRIAPVELGATEVCSPIGDGTFQGFIKGGGDYWVDTQVFGYDGSFARLFRVKIPGTGMAFSDQDCRCANAQFAVWTGADGVRRAACPDKGGGALYLFEMPDAELVTQYAKRVAKPEGWASATVWYNELSGHLNALCKTDAEGYFVVAWDLELNPILGEDGTQRRVPAPDWATYSHGTSPSINVIRIYGRTFVWDTGWTAWGGNNANFALFASTAEDGMEAVHEHIPLPDPDAPSICKRTVDAEGNIVIDDPKVNGTRPRLETEDVGVLLFCAKQPERRKLPSGATNGPPALALSYGITLFSDGVNIYWLTKDGRFINASYCTLKNTAQPGYKGNNPTAATAPWPPPLSNSPVVAVGSSADCYALVVAKTAEWSTFKQALQYMGQVCAANAKLTRWSIGAFFSVAPCRSNTNAARLGALFGKKFAYYTDYDYLASTGGTFGGCVP